MDPIVSKFSITRAGNRVKNLLPESISIEFVSPPLVAFCGLVFSFHSSDRVVHLYIDDSDGPSSKRWMLQGVSDEGDIDFTLGDLEPGEFRFTVAPIIRSYLLEA